MAEGGGGGAVAAAAVPVPVPVQVAGGGPTPLTTCRHPSQAFVVAAAQAGRHNARRESYGHALVVVSRQGASRMCRSSRALQRRLRSWAGRCAQDPWGAVLARLPDPAATGIAMADLDPELLSRTRLRMPCGPHRAKGRLAYAHAVGQPAEPQGSGS